MKANDVLKFWFEEIDPKMHFSGGADFDEQVKLRFLEAFYDVMAGKTENWRKTAEGRLAEILILDQFSRNMFRGKPEAFSGDGLAQKLAKEAVAAGADQELPVKQRVFFYMPYMHSEKKEDHEVAMKLFSQHGLENNLEFEIMHKKIIDRFGRYPHRNLILGRVSTDEEIDFLKQKNSSF